MIGKSKVNKLISIILCSALMIGLMPSNVLAASKPTVTKKMTINVGQSKTIKVTGKYIKSKTFKSNKKSVATVSKKGKVTGKKVGTAKITVTVKYKKSKNSKKSTTKKYTCTVKVNVRKSAVPTNKPVITKKPNVTQKPSVTEKPKATPEPPKDSSGPQNTELPNVTEVPKNSEEPHNTEVPSVTNKPQSTPDVPVATETPSNTEKPDTTTEPNPTKTPSSEEKKYDYTFSEDGINIGIVWAQYPSTTQKGIYEWYNVDTRKSEGNIEVPVLDSIETIDGIKYGIYHKVIPTCTNYGVDYIYDLRNGRHTSKRIPATGHTSDEIWHTRVDSDGEAGDIWNECVRCGVSMNRINVCFKENNYIYTEWLQTPSETQEGIMGVYKGVNIKNMTTEQLEEKYDSYNVVFDDGTKDTYYGDIIYYDDGEIMAFDVYAKSTVQQIGTLTYPKYEVVEIDLGNGEKTKVYGYYDRNISDKMYTLLNEYRKENGLNELIKTDDMQSLADIRSAEAFYTEMYNQTHTDYEYIAHERPNKTRYSTVYGYNNPLAGENETVTTLISKFQASGITQAIDLTAEYEMNAFKNSEGHNYNLLYNKYTHVGMSTFIGYPQRSDGTFKNYKVAITIQVFDYKLSKQE